MASYRPLTDIPISLLSNSSRAATGYVIYAYLTGTTTPATLYQDAIGTSAGSSITLDSRGEPTTIKRIWLDMSVTYKLVLKTDTGATVWTVDPVYGSPVQNISSIYYVPVPATSDITSGLTAAYNSNAAIIQLPAGSYTYSSTLDIDRGVIIRGAGSCAGGTVADRVSGGATGDPGENTTQLTFTGTSGAAIRIIGTGVEGLENVHLSDFALVGNSSCDGGIKIGSGVVVSKSSFKNLYVEGFTNTGTDKGYGIYIGNCIESLFENVYTRANRDGINIYGTATTIEFRQVYSRINSRYGMLIQQLNGCSLDKVVLEANAGSGLAINARNGQSISALSFYHLYTEANCDSISGPVITIDKTGTGSCIDVIFYRPTIYETVAGNVTRLIKFNTCDSIKFLETSLTAWTAGFAECTSGTSGCVISGRAGNAYAQTNVTGQGFDSDGARRVLLTSGDPAMKTWSPSLISGGTTTGFGTCRYVRDGNVVTVFGSLTLTAISGTLKIGTLPFAPIETVCNGMASKVSTVGIDAVVSDADGYVYLYFNNTYAGAGNSCYFSATYYI